jgi:hypothetical protein
MRKPLISQVFFVRTTRHFYFYAIVVLLKL